LLILLSNINTVCKSDRERVITLRYKDKKIIIEEHEGYFLFICFHTHLLSFYNKSNIYIVTIKPVLALA
jgi:hypothetical protein